MLNDTETCETMEFPFRDMYGGMELNFSFIREIFPTDIIEPINLIITESKNFMINEIKLYVGELSYCSYFLHMNELLNLKPVIHNNYEIYDLCWNKLFPTRFLDMNKLRDKRIIMAMTYSGRCANASLIAGVIHNVKNNLIMPKCNYTFYNFIYEETGKLNYTKIEMKALTNGLFIYGTDINKIDEIFIMIDGKMFIRLNNPAHIFCACLQVSRICFYLPLTTMPIKTIDEIFNPKYPPVNLNNMSITIRPQLHTTYIACLNQSTITM